MFQRIGIKEGHVCQPTYVYPEEVKMLLRSVFSKDICDYPNPSHNNVSINSTHHLYVVMHEACNLFKYAKNTLRASSCLCVFFQVVYITIEDLYKVKINWSVIPFVGLMLHGQNECHRFGLDYF